MKVKMSGQKNGIKRVFHFIPPFVEAIFDPSFIGAVFGVQKTQKVPGSPSETFYTSKIPAPKPGIKCLPYFIPYFMCDKFAGFQISRVFGDQNHRFARLLVSPFAGFFVFFKNVPPLSGDETSRRWLSHIVKNGPARTLNYVINYLMHKILSQLILTRLYSFGVFGFFYIFGLSSHIFLFQNERGNDTAPQNPHDRTIRL